MRRLVVNEEHQEAHEQEQPHQHQPHETSYLDFLATHPPVFVETTDAPEADSWLCTIEAKFGLLRCFEVQKTLFIAQQFCGSVSVWWVTFTTTLPNGY
jgi:hypothetical protein